MMKLAITLALSIVCWAASSSLSAAIEFTSATSTSKGDVIGDFHIIAKARKKSIILGNNKAYKPTHHHYAKIAKTWRRGNRIRLIKAENHEFILINLSRAQTIKTKLLKLAE